MICRPNKCINCDTLIHLPGETFEDKVKRGVYKETVLSLSNGSKMRVGICNECLKKVDSLDKSDMLEAIKQTWRQTISENRKEALEAQIKDLTVNA